MNIYDRNRGEFRRLPGPVFTNLLLADEINRAVPRLIRPAGGHGRAAGHH